MALTSPSAFCALAMTALASCAIAVPPRHATQVATRTRFLSTIPPLLRRRMITTNGPGRVCLELDVGLGAQPALEKLGIPRAIHGIDLLHGDHDSQAPRPDRRPVRTAKDIAAPRVAL